jgi:hypothetical protein
MFGKMTIIMTEVNREENLPPLLSKYNYLDLSRSPPIRIRILAALKAYSQSKNK